MIKASILLGVALCASRLLRRRSASERHLWWAGVLATAAVLPLLSGLLPSWEPEMARRAMAALPVLSRVIASNDANEIADVVVHAEAVDAGVVTLSRVVMAVWIGGMSLVVLALFMAGRRLAGSLAEARSFTDPVWHGLLSELSVELASRRRIQLIEGHGTCAPVTWGVFRPCVVLPASAATWPLDRRRVVLAHEIAHVRRNDWAVQLMAKLVCAIYWFNPLFWAAFRRLCRESEQACDDLVLSLGVDGDEYATHLLDIARTFTNGAGLRQALSVARPSSLERRFRALLSPGSNRRTATRRFACLVAGVMLLVAVPLAAVTLPGAFATIQVRTANLPALPESSATASAPHVMSAIGRVRTSAPGDSDSAAFTPPEVLEYSAPPLYSEEARRRGIEGTVSLDVGVDTVGHAHVLRVVKSLGFGLDQNARLAVSHWQFAPATRAGVPIDSTVEIGVTFSLANEALNELIANDMATRVGPGIVPPRIVRRVAVSPGVQASGGQPGGAVVLDVVLLEDGAPKVVRIVRSLDTALDQEAVRAFEQWRFSPALKDGAPVKVRMNAEITFHTK